MSRGKYLVTLVLCTDCHTPGYVFGKPDTDRFLGGSEVGFEIPGLGVFHGLNLTRTTTPASANGPRTTSSGRSRPARPDGRLLAPIMPWHAFAQLTG